MPGVLDRLLDELPDISEEPLKAVSKSDPLENLFADLPDVKAAPPSKPEKPLRGTEAFGGRIPGVPEPEKPLALQSDEEQATSINRAIARPSTLPGRTFKPLVSRLPDAMPGAPPKEDLENLAISMGLEGVGAIAASKVASVAQAAKLAQTAVSAYFATAAGMSAVKTVPEAWDLYKKGDYMGAIGKLGQGGTEAVIATLAGLHARGEFKGAADIAKTENVLRENLKAQETARAAQERADAAAAQAKAPRIGTEPPPEPAAPGTTAAPEPPKPGPTNPVTPDPLSQVVDEAPAVTAEHGYANGQVFDTPEGTYSVTSVKGGTVLGDFKPTGKKARPFFSNIERFQGLVGTPAGQTAPPAPPAQTEQAGQAETVKSPNPLLGDEESAYQQSLAIVREAGQASTSTLQRKLHLGYGVAARMLDRMEAEGIIGPADGSKPRAILTPESATNSPTIASPEAAIAVPPLQEATIPEANGLSQETVPLSTEATSPSSAVEAVTPAIVPDPALTQEKHDYASTQVNLPESVAAPLLKAGAWIPESELAEDGVEKHPHVTALYGLTGEDPAEVEKAVAGHGPVTVKLGKASIFQTPDADVLKVDVESPELHALNAKLRKLPNENEYPDYVPHATIAYLKPGEGGKYDGREVEGVTGQEITLDSLSFMGKDGKETKISLTGEAAGSKEVIPAQSGTQQPAAEVATEPEKSTGAPGLIDAVYGKLKAGESLGNVTELTKLAEQHFGSSRTSGQWSPKDMFDAMEAGINKYLLDQGKELMGMPFEQGLASLRELMARVTSQGVRTEEQLKKQQFSTPPTESYLAAKVAGILPDDIVLEPSAGNGGLAIWAKAVGAKVHVNEISERRSAMMKAIGLPEATFHDGEIIAALLDRSIRPTVVLMNPPFSAGALKSGPARNRNMYGFNHVDSALQALVPGGRLVAILGGGQANEPDGGASLTGGQSGEWFKKIGAQYTVRANVRIHGKEYQKYGTAFATRIIVIDKTGPTKDLGVVVKGNADTLDEAYNLLRDVAETRPEVQARAVDRTGAGEGVSGTSVGTGASASIPGEPGILPGGAAGSEVEKLADRPEGIDRGAGAVQPNAGSEPAPRVESESQPARTDASPTTGSVESRNQDIDYERPLAGTETLDAGLELGRAEEQLESTEEDSTPYVSYTATIKGPKHPGDIVETKTMATVPLPEITYKPNLPESVVKDGKLSAVQLEAIAIVGQQNNIVLPDGSRASALIGDGTGVGKGRIAAGVLLDNYRSGRKRLVWVSEKWDLMQDAMRDLSGIGATELMRGIDNQNGKFIPGPKSAVVPFKKYGYGHKIEHDGVLFTTYGTVRSQDKKGNRRVAQLEQYLRGDDDGEGAYIIFDEAHNLKNAVPAQGTDASQIGKAVKELLERLPKLRTGSLSATAATEVRNLGYLDRLGLWGAGTAFPNGFTEFQNQVADGGMAAMELIARELKAQGKYISRTLSFKGVTYDQKEHALTPEQKELFRTAVKAWAAVVQQAEATIAQTTNGGAMARGRFLSLFYGAQLRFFNLLITTLKIPTAVEVANKALGDGKSVVISLVNTNEAAQNREKNKARDESDDDELPDYDFGPKEMLVDLVRQHYPVQQYADDVDANGNPIKVPVYYTDDSGRELPRTNPEAERQRDALIAQLNKDLHMPENPLDILIQNLGGDKKVAELTGRKEKYDAGSGRFISRGDPGTKKDDINLMEMRAFQSGKKRVAVLSNAAGTGISLHAGNDVLNKQKRVMITLQVGWSADKQMQMFGRVHRTNQASAPEYVFLVSDLGGEKRFVSTIARRLGSLGALTKGQKDASSGTDLMEKVNFETDQGRQATNSFYSALLRDQPVPGTGLTGRQILDDLRVLKTDPRTGIKSVPREDLTNVTKLLNRLLALDPDTQNGVYNYFYDIFQASVQDAIDRGVLDTGVKTLPGDEFSLKEQRSISKDPKTNADTWYYKVEAKERMPRVSPEELEKRLKGYRRDNVDIWVTGKERDKVVLAMDAQPIVRENGDITPAVYVSRPADGRWRKIPKAEFERSAEKVHDFASKKFKEITDKRSSVEEDLSYMRKQVERNPSSGSYYQRVIADSEKQLESLKKEQDSATKFAVDSEQWAKDLWETQYKDAPSHNAVDRHMIGGAVMRFWNPIKEATNIGHSIFTAADSKTNKRIVGIDIPSGEIAPLLARITGGESTVSVGQLHDDVLRNNTQYELEGGIQVRRGRVGPRAVIQLIPPSPDVAENLVRLGAQYERGVVPIYYIPTSASTSNQVLNRILEQYPVKAQPQSDVRERSVGRDPERGAVPLGAAVTFLQQKFGENGPKANYSGIGAMQDRTVRNLSQLVRANTPGHEAALRAASSKAHASAILRAAVPAITKALEGSGVTWADMRLALIEGRLRGIKDRWEQIADSVEPIPDNLIAEAYTERFSGLLESLEGKRDIPEDVAQTAAALVEAQDWESLRAFLGMTFYDAADSVTSVMEPGAFDTITTTPQVMAALDIFKRLVEKPMAENHALNEGVFSDALGPLDTYYPLIPLEREFQGGPGRRLPYHKPKNMANKFATGLAEGYQATTDALRDRLTKAVRANDKASLLKTLEDEGLLLPIREGQESVEYEGIEYQGERVEISPGRQIIKDGQSIYVKPRMGIMPRWLFHELRPILEGERFSPPTISDKVLRALNTFSLAGPADFVFHAANVLGSIVANTPFLGTSLTDKALSVPLLKKFTAIVKVMNVDPTTPEAAAELIEMSKVGVLPSRYGSETFSKRAAEEMGAERKRFSFSPMLYGPKGLDVRARVLMWRIAKQINPSATPRELNLFVNQLGNYVPALQGGIERALKSSGWSPFYTAGSTMIRNGINAFTGMGPMPKAGFQYRLWQQLTGGAVGLIALWAMTYKSMTGKWPWEDKRAKLLAIPIGEGNAPVDRFRHSKLGDAMWGPGRDVGYLNFAFFNPISMRGMRALGLPGAFETKILGGSAGQATEAAQRDVINAFAHPMLGPVPRAVFVGVFGREPYVTGLRDMRGQVSPQLFPAIPPKTVAGGPALVRRGGAAIKELNSFYGDMGSATGFLGEDQGQKGNHWLRLVMDLATPGLIGNATNPYGRGQILRQQRNGMR